MMIANCKSCKVIEWKIKQLKNLLNYKFALKSLYRLSSTLYHRDIRDQKIDNSKLRNEIKRLKE